MKPFLLLGGLALIAISGFGHRALAADLPLKAPPPSAAPVAPTWTGFYVGAHAGAALQSVPDWSFVDPNQLPSTFTGATLSGDSNRSGAVGGMQGGYNWQFSPAWVVGVEGDMSWTSLRDHRLISGLAGKNGSFCSACTMQMSGDAQWLASVRGRLGFIAFNTLIYGTGGAAWEKVAYSAVGNFNQFGSDQSASSFGAVKSGWVVGAGAEWQMSSNILIRAEYLYYRVPSETATAAVCSGGVCGAALAPETALPYQYTWASSNIQVARIAASYKF